MGALDNLLDEHEATAAAEAKGETDVWRRAFIRYTAQQLFIRGYAAGKNIQPHDAWAFAKLLWERKPEDC